MKFKKMRRMKCMGMSIEVAEMKIEMLERIIVQLEKEVDNYRSQMLLMITNGKMSNVHNGRITTQNEIKQNLYDAMKKNMDKLTSTTIKGCLESSYPAELQMIQIIEKILNGECTEGVLIKCMNGGLCKYKDNNEIKTITTTVLFDKIFKEIYEYVRVYAIDYPEDGCDDMMYVKLNNSYNNVMMLTSGRGSKNKEKIQKEIIRIVKNNAFSNR